MFPSMDPGEWETHAGEDVGVFAVGPWSHLFGGNYEQTFIPHAIAYAANMGPGAREEPDQHSGSTNSFPVKSAVVWCAVFSLLVR